MSDFHAGLTPGDKLDAGLTDIALGKKASDGSRTLTVHTDNTIDQASIRIDAAMKPVIDSEGNYRVDMVIKNPMAPNHKLPVALSFHRDGSINMKPSEFCDLFSRATGQGVNLSVPGAARAAESIVSFFAARGLKLIDR